MGFSCEPGLVFDGTSKPNTTWEGEGHPRVRFADVVVAPDSVGLLETERLKLALRLPRGTDQLSTHDLLSQEPMGMTRELVVLEVDHLRDLQVDEVDCENESGCEKVEVIQG